MRYLPFRPLFDLKPWWDEEDWPEVSVNQGLNIYEENNQIVTQAAVPGIPADKIKVTYEGGALRISGKTEEKEDEKKKGKIIHRWEKVSSFNYVTTLPRPVDSKSIEAIVKDGVITVKASVAEEAKAREVVVKTG